MCEEIHDVQFQIKRASQNEPNKYLPVYLSEKIHGNANPTWTPFKRMLSAISNGDEACPLRIVIVSRDNEVGHADFTISMLVDQKNYDVKLNGQPAGTIQFRQFTKVEKPSFTSILRSGW